jgi:hypothetical protein
MDKKPYIWMNREIKNFIDEKINEEEMIKYLTTEGYNDNQIQEMKKLEIYVLPAENGLCVAIPANKKQEEVIIKYGSLNEVRKKSTELLNQALEQYLNFNTKEQIPYITDITINDNSIEKITSEIESAVKENRKIDGKLLDQEIKHHIGLSYILDTLN